MKFIYGDDKFLVDEVVNKLRISNKFTCVIFDAEKAIDELLFKIDSFSFFSTNELILVKCSKPFNSKDSQNLIKSLKTNPDLKILFIYYGSDFKSNALFKFLSNTYETKNVKSLSKYELIQKIILYAKSISGYIDYNTAKLLIETLALNYFAAKNELDKLVLGDPYITKEAISISTIPLEKTNPFGLANAIVSKNINEIIANYLNLISTTSSFEIVIGQVSSVFGLAILVHSYQEYGYSLIEISKDTKIHSFRIKKAYELLNHSSIDDISLVMEKLVKYDYEIKTGSVNYRIAANYFLIQLLKY